MGEDMEAAMVAAEDTVEAMADTVEREKPKPNPKLMLNQKPTLWLKPMLMPMLTMDMVVMVDTEAMEDMVDTDTAVNEEAPMPKLMLKPMPTTDTAVVMVDTEVMVDMVDTDMDVNADPLMLTMDMVVMVDTVMDMVDTDMAVNQSSLIFIVPKNQNNNLFPTYQRKIQTASF